MDPLDGENAGTALYAPYQTSLYIAPPVVNGQIPKNVYGNLDVYAPSMVPPGGSHIPHAETARAARILGVDYADAVTGFSFKGRHGTAITNGAVVAAEYQEAVEETIKAFEDERASAEEERRVLAALKKWKRFLAGLRIRERIEGYEIEGERDTAMRYEMETAEDEDEDEYLGGGFLPDRGADEPAQPTATTMPMRNLADMANDDLGGVFFADVDEGEEMEATPAPDRFVNKVNDDDNEGGFLLDHDSQDDEQVMRGTSRGNLENTNLERNDNFAGYISASNGDQETVSQGGGFLHDDYENRDEALPTDKFTETLNPDGSMLDNHNSIDPRDPARSKEISEEAVSDLPVGRIEEAKMSQPLDEPQGSEHLPAFKQNDAAPTPNELSQSPPIRETIVGGEQGTSTYSTILAEERSESDSSEEDKGSLLSHDPEDEDADPEWLA